MTFIFKGFLIDDSLKESYRLESGVRGNTRPGWDGSPWMNQKTTFECLKVRRVKNSSRRGAKVP